MNYFPQDDTMPVTYRKARSCREDHALEESWLYRHSLSLALACLFLLAFTVHALATLDG